MNSLLSPIGLALDFVGAVVIVIGLFRPVRGLTPGWAYDPDDAARDTGFAVAGAPLLALGFFFQSLTYFGLSVECSNWVNGVASAAALIVGIVYALVAYEVTHRLVFDWRCEQSRRDLELDYPFDRRRGLWFWRGRRPVRFWRDVSSSGPMVPGVSDRTSRFEVLYRRVPIFGARELRRPADARHWGANVIAVGPGDVQAVSASAGHKRKPPLAPTRSRMGDAGWNVTSVRSMDM